MSLSPSILPASASHRIAIENSGGNIIRIRLHIGIATIFVVIVSALAAVIVWNNHLEASAAAERTADQLFKEVSAKTDERVNRLLSAVKATVDIASAVPSLANEPEYDGLAYPALKAMIRFLEVRPHVYTVAAGFSSGASIQVMLARGDAVAAAFDAPDAAYFVVRTISQDRHGNRHQYVRSLDRDHRVVDAKTEESPNYDPRDRIWYHSALIADETVFSDPFIFAALQKPGITASRRLIGGGGVISVALTLSNMADLLAAQPVSPNAIAFVFNSKHKILVQSPNLLTETADPNEFGTDSELPKVNQTGNSIIENLVRLGKPSAPAVSGALRFDVEGQSYMARIEPVGAQFGFGQFVAVAAPLADFTEHITRMQRRNVVTSLIALLIALPLIYLIAKRVAARLAELADEADKIRRFDLDSPINAQSIFQEVHNLARAFSSMKQAVRLFTRYVPKALVQEIITSGSGGDPGGDRREISILFSDIADYTRIAEDTDPEDLMQRTSTYFETLGAVISKHSGVVDKYIGDAVMALWNAPHQDRQHVANACAATLGCRAASRKLAEQWRSQGILPFNTRFGLHCGEAVVGNIGGADRINFTAVGATINLASRLEALNKMYGTEILISQDVVARIDGQFLSRLIDRVQPAGVNQPVDIYELMAIGSGDDNQRKLSELWQGAMTLFAERNWSRAMEAFTAIALCFPDDRPAALYLERSDKYISFPPDVDWDGVTRLTSK